MVLEKTMGCYSWMLKLSFLQQNAVKNLQMITNQLSNEHSLVLRVRRAWAPIWHCVYVLWLICYHAYALLHVSSILSRACSVSDHDVPFSGAPSADQDMFDYKHKLSNNISLDLRRHKEISCESNSICYRCLRFLRSWLHVCTNY